MKVVVEFDMVDCSMHKHRDFFERIYDKYGWAMRDCQIIEPEKYDVKKEVWEKRDRELTDSVNHQLKT